MGHARLPPMTVKERTLVRVRVNVLRQKLIHAKEAIIARGKADAKTLQDKTPARARVLVPFPFQKKRGQKHDLLSKQP